MMAKKPAVPVADLSEVLDASTMSDPKPVVYGYASPSWIKNSPGDALVDDQGSLTVQYDSWRANRLANPDDGATFEHAGLLCVIALCDELWFGAVAFDHVLVDRAMAAGWRVVSTAAGHPCGAFVQGPRAQGKAWVLFGDVDGDRWSMPTQSVNVEAGSMGAAMALVRERAEALRDALAVVDTRTRRIDLGD